jgi:hypothetical protein
LPLTARRDDARRLGDRRKSGSLPARLLNERSFDKKASRQSTMRDDGQGSRRTIYFRTEKSSRLYSEAEKTNDKRRAGYLARQHAA